MNKAIMLLMMSVFVLTSCKKEATLLELPMSIETSTKQVQAAISTSKFSMPDETQPHEGTWLQWPHHYQYGTTYRNRLDATWIAMTKALAQSEKVHIIAYNTAEQARITTLIKNAGIALTNIDFKIIPTNDVWIRDNGPIFVKDAAGKLTIEDWGFNGWGNKTPYTKDDVVPIAVATATSLPIINLNSNMKLEGGAFEIDGNGTFLATKSAILNKNRNPNLTQAQAEAILSQNLGVTNFIWLTGVPNADLTDMHIDGFARFGNSSTIVTMAAKDLQYWELSQADISKLTSAKNKNGSSYTLLNLPLTKSNVVTAYGKKLGYKGSYVNFYVANTKVLVPNYNDANDAVANQLLQKLYPSKTVVGIDCRNLYENGGMVHCVTQQQPK